MKLSLHNPALILGLLAVTAFGLSGQARAHALPGFGPATPARLLQPVHYRHPAPPPRWLHPYYRHHHRPWWRHGYYAPHRLRRHYRHVPRWHHHPRRVRPHGSYLYFEYRY